MRLVRVFPRVTRATPDDELARFGPPGLFDEADEVHVSVAFTADKARAEMLAEQWQRIAPTKVGGVAYGDRGEDFIPGRYIKHGYTFSSRGCPERCWFCSVWKRDPQIRLLPIQEGWNILDDNLLATPEDHFRAVIAMLSTQGRRVEFTGGLQAARLERLPCRGIYVPENRVPFSLGFAYDPGDKFETMRPIAAEKMLGGWIHSLRRAQSKNLRANRLSERHIRQGRGAAPGNDGHRIHAIRDALATRDSKRREVATRAGMEEIPEELGKTSNYSS